RLRLVRALPGETIDQLAVRVRSVWSPQQIAIANALETGTGLQGGFLLKIARAEPLSPSPGATRGDDAEDPLGGAASRGPRGVGDPVRSEFCSVAWDTAS